MQALARISGPVSFRPMPKDQDGRPSDNLAGKVLKTLRERANLTQEAAASRLTPPVAEVTWQRWEWGMRELTVPKLVAAGEAIGFTLLEVMSELAEVAGSPQLVISNPGRGGRRSRPSEPLYIRDTVQAGGFFPADDISQVARTYPCARDPRFRNAAQWLDEVRGDSVDLLRIFDGDLAQFVDAYEIDYHPRTGDVVEVVRTRFDGRERELSIKQVEVTPEKVLLWPRSSNARWSEPLCLTDGIDDADHIEVRIRGVLLRTIRTQFLPI